MVPVSVPKYEEFFNPLLSALHKLGGSSTISELVESVSDIMKLPQEVRDLVHKEGRSTVVEYRLAWARTYLKKAGLVENSERGVWSLTAKGQTTQRVDPKAIQRLVRSMVASERTARATEDEEPSLDAEDGGTKDWKAALVELLLTLPPDAFERLCQRLLRESGFIQVEVTGKSGDGGIDGHGIVRLAGLLSFPVIFQAKRYSGSVSAGDVRNFRGAMVGRAEKGLLITTGTFTASARAEATRDGAPPIDLVDGYDLAGKLKELRLGIATRMVENVEIDAEWFRRL